MNVYLEDEILWFAMKDEGVSCYEVKNFDDMDSIKKRDEHLEKIKSAMNVSQVDIL